MDTLNVEEVGEFSGDKPTVERRGRPARQLKDDIYSYGPTNSCKWKYNSYNSGYISSIKYWGVLSNVLVNQSNDTKTYTHQTYSGWWFGTLFFWFSIQLGMSSSQLTNSIIFQRGRYTNHQPAYIIRFYIIIYYNSNIKPLKILRYTMVQTINLH